MPIVIQPSLLCTQKIHTLNFFRKLNPLGVHNITISAQICQIVIVYISRIFL